MATFVISKMKMEQGGKRFKRRQYCIISPDTPQGKWPLGIVLRVFPGSDGYTRAVKVQVGAKEYTGSISKT